MPWQLPKAPCILLAFSHSECRRRGGQMKGQLSRQMDGIIFLPLPSLSFLLQGHCEGVHGPAEPGPIPALQHAAPPDPGPVDPEEPHPLQPHHARLRLARHRRRPHGHPGESRAKNMKVMSCRDALWAKKIHHCTVRACTPRQTG